MATKIPLVRDDCVENCFNFELARHYASRMGIDQTTAEQSISDKVQAENCTTGPNCEGQMCGATFVYLSRLEINATVRMGAVSSQAV